LKNESKEKLYLNNTLLQGIIMALSREQIAQRIAQELQDGFYVNLGIGIPTLVANYIPSNIQVCLQSENGLLGMGPYPTDKTVDADLINAGKETVTANTGASFFSSADSFAMIRGGHIDLTVLGAFEVDTNGNIASWMIPDKLIKGMGGAMDLVAGAENIVVAMAHANKKGESKLLKHCSLPLTGVNCIKKIVTDLAVLEVKDGAFHLLERAPGVSIDEIKDKTEGELVISESVKEITIQ
jgi:3-oxoacid CoA-transferase subunit B